jgi:hypothetical protein
MKVGQSSNEKGEFGEGEAKGSQPTLFTSLSLGVVGSLFTTSTFSTNESKTFFLQHRFGVKKSKALLLKVAYLKCFFLWNVHVEKFGWAVVGQLQISERAAKRAQ